MADGVYDCSECSPASVVLSGLVKTAREVLRLVTHMTGLLPRRHVFVQAVRAEAASSTIAVALQMLNPELTTLLSVLNRMTWPSSTGTLDGPEVPVYLSIAK